MKKDETIQFLTMQGWEIYPNRPDNKVVLNKYWDEDYDDNDTMWFTIKEALGYEQTDNPTAYNEWMMIDSLDSRSYQVMKDYMDD